MNKSKSKPKTQSGNHKEKTTMNKTTTKKPIRTRSSMPERHRKTFNEPSLTKQAPKSQCDINKIVKRHRETGQVSHINHRAGHYGYAPNINLQEAIQLVNDARSEFASIPAEIRRHFENDPAKFADFASDAQSVPQLLEWGLLDPSDFPDEFEALQRPSEPLTAPAPTNGGNDSKGAE